VKRILPLLFIISILIPLAASTPVQAAPLLLRVESLQQAQETTCETATIHYARRNADYDGWGLHVWGPTPLVSSVSWESPLSPNATDDFGLYWDVALDEGAEYLNYIIHNGDEKDPGPDQTMTFAEVGCEIWQIQGKPDQFTSVATALDAFIVKTEAISEVSENQAVLHYRRNTEDYDGWGLHIWGPTTVEDVTWTTPLLPTGHDEYGIYWIVDLEPDADYLNYIVHKGDEKDPGPDQTLDFNTVGRQVWLIQGSSEQFSSAESGIQGLLIAGVGDIKNKSQAHWLTREIIAWQVEFGDKAIYTLHYDPNGAIQVTQEGLEGGEQIELEFMGNQLSEELAEQFPHLWNARMLKIPADYLEMVPEIIKGQYAITVQAPDGSILGATALQIPGVLDDLYANNEPLGVTFEAGAPTLSVWAPTAKSVKLLLYEDSKNPEGQEIPMTCDPNTAIWSVTGESDWVGKYYLYDVEVFVRQEGAVVHNLVTDPYSFSLSMNSTRSQIVDLNDQTLAPDGWDTLSKPELAAFTDIVLYELHIRDFSAIDQTIPEDQRGTFMAFTHPESNGMQHLAWLAEHGVTHIHLLPAFDIATINEDKPEWQNVDFAELATLPPASEEQQAAANAVRGIDPFNWGYDPLHYTVPEGSYGTNPDGPSRILEFRQMVQALNETGLRVVMDVVYNHTNASGQSDKSVLDKVVPGYYHRLDASGNVTTSTCCQNTGTEHAMMRKLMIDSVLTWVTQYKVDGFRFDLMGHHMKADMEALRSALDALTLETDGVDGKMVYIYGEGWDFGEVEGNMRGVNATQTNMAGTGIGTFNDRMRDAVRGGNPFRDKQEQGYATGMYTDPNEVNNLPEKSQLALLLDLKDQIRISLAGNLADYQLVNAYGQTVTGAEIGYNGEPAGYTASPEENVVYVSAHDNETLFDAIQYKAPLSASMEDRVRMQSLSLSLVALSQGVPFFHAGSEILRSKSMDSDSYDSTDWFNAIDWTYTDNNWGHGLPLQDKNGSMWPVIQPLLANLTLTPEEEDILTNLALFEQWLEIRWSSPLFRLQTADQIESQVKFHNTGPDQIPGLIVMSISDDPAVDIDPNYGVVIVLWNADPEAVSFRLAEWKAGELALHPLLVEDPYISQASYHRENQTFNIPGRSTVVFVSASPIENALEPVSPETEKLTATVKPEVTTPNQLSQQETEFPAAYPRPQSESTLGWQWVALGIILVVAGFFAWYLSKRRKG
jgi:pullulanase